MDWRFHQGSCLGLCCDDQALLILVLRTLIWCHFKHLVFRSHTGVNCRLLHLHHDRGSRSVGQARRLLHHLLLLLRFVRLLHGKSHHLEAGVLHG